MNFYCHLLLVSFIFSCLALSPAHPAMVVENRWVFCQNALENAADLEKLQSLVTNAKAAGFNGMVLSSRFDSLTLQPPDHIERLKQLHAFCTKNGLDLIPFGFSIGYASALLFENKNWAEGFPVRDLMFKVSSGKVVPGESLPRPQIIGMSRSNNKDLPADSISMPPGDNLVTGDFKNLDRTGLILEDPGKVTFSDATVTHSGRPSLRLENFSANPHGNARLCKDLDVTPYQSYEISFWYRAEDLTAGTPLMAQVYTTEGQALTWKSMEQPASDWKRFTFEFNSLEHTRVRVYLGVWGGRAGKIWIDDLSISRQKSLTRLIRRAGTPVTVTNASTKLIYTEGSDFSIEESPRISDDYLITINPQGRIAENTLLAVNYYRSYVMGNDQISACMAIPEVYEIWKKQLSLIEKLLHPKAYFFSMDEIRQGGHCGLCDQKNMARLLGECITSQYNMVKALNKDAKVYVWGDMLDPNMGAISEYCMVRGGFPHSWEHVPKEILPVVWNYTSRDMSLFHFKKNGFTTMASINVDEGASTGWLKEWKVSLVNSSNRLGVMYTTWHDDYSHFKEFGETYFE